MLRPHHSYLRGKNVRVSSNSGAHFCDVQEDLERDLKRGDICAHCVTEIVLVVGGNDAQNAKSFHKIQTLNESFVRLLDFTTYSFRNARVNVFSTIPRILVDQHHLSRIFHTNDFMFNVTNQYANCRFVNVSSHFLRWDRLSNEMILDRKLFNDSWIHFSKVGTSVLAKVIIGVIYRPWPLIKL